MSGSNGVNAGSPHGHLWSPASWPAPPGVRTAITGRFGGVSKPPYDQLNLALHVGDDPAAVAENRARLLASTDARQIIWLQQVHGTRVLDASTELREIGSAPEADGVFTTRPGVACAILTADCIPVLMCDRAGRQVAAVHAGWRGLADGILARGIERFQMEPRQLLAWLGPAISAGLYEVDEGFIEALGSRVELTRDGPLWQQTVTVSPGRPGHYQFNLHALARWQLQQLGVSGIYGGTECTASQADRFYSYRRDGVTGRFASLIWIAPPGSAQNGHSISDIAS